MLLGHCRQTHPRHTHTHTTPRAGSNRLFQLRDEHNLGNCATSPPPRNSLAYWCSAGNEGMSLINPPLWSPLGESPGSSHFSFSTDQQAEHRTHWTLLVPPWQGLRRPGSPAASTSKGRSASPVSSGLVATCRLFSWPFGWDLWDLFSKNGNTLKWIGQGQKVISGRFALGK